MATYPALRLLDFQSVYHHGQQMWYLRDPMQLSQYQIIMPPALAQMLLFCDGTRTPQQIYEAFCHHVGERVDFELIADGIPELS